MTPPQAQKVYEVLDKLHIPYVKHEHPPAFTVEQANQYWGNVEGLHCKNLFFRNKKGRRHYLAVFDSTKDLELKEFYGQVGERLSFASPERLMKYLGITPGSVSPFGLINDANHEVIVLLDEDIKRVEKISFHPNINTATVTILRTDFDKFLDHCGNSIRYIEI